MFDATNIHALKKRMQISQHTVNQQLIQYACNVTYYISIRYITENVNITIIVFFTKTFYNYLRILLVLSILQRQKISIFEQKK